MYEPRQFTLFGANSLERSEIYNLCYRTERVRSFKEALALCKQLYEQKLLQRRR